MDQNIIRVARYGRSVELFWDQERSCFFINKDGDLAVDCLRKDQVIDAWFEEIIGENDTD